jgi:hypothetical protein
MPIAPRNDSLLLDLSDLDIEEVETLLQPGTRSAPEFAASTTVTGQDAVASSCTLAEEFGGHL